MAEPSKRARALRILVVEDDHDSREFIAEFLRLTGDHAISLTESAESGLQHIRGETYDLIVTDLELPGASGLEMLDQAKAEGRLAQTVVVACTSNKWLRRQALERGAIFILKPVDFAQMGAVVRSAAL